MTLINEVEKVIAELPLPEATMLRFWLDEYQAARRYKKLKAYILATKTLDNFEKGNSNASWN